MRGSPPSTLQNCDEAQAQSFRFGYYGNTMSALTEVPEVCTVETIVNLPVAIRLDFSLSQRFSMRVILSLSISARLPRKLQVGGSVMFCCA